MLRLPPFQFRVAKTLNEAADILVSEGAAEHEDNVRLVAGGTDLWPNMKRRHQKARTVVSLMSVPGIKGIDVNGDIRIGATTILEDIVRDASVRERYPAFARAVASISSPPLRHMGTIGGNICVDTRCTYYNQTEDWRRSVSYCMKEDGQICWVATSSPRCLAHTASDSAPMLCALGAGVRLVSTEGDRVIPIEKLYKDDGIEYLAKRPEEIVAGVLLTKESEATRCRSAFWKLRRRGSIDFAVLSSAVALWTDKAGVVEKARIYLGAVGSYPVAAQEASDFLVGKTLTPETIAEAARLARKPSYPMDNTDFAPQWRGAMVVKYTEAALREAAGLPTERLGPKHA
ncbi:MAG TPA: FAD binding domain-containing protein [Thermoanaerobaculia bacterium]|jgi:4-hydroxybenzoyl-CoA reductase subunit beta|nr:FAD binding domain-containing protein [Thermoanaerobaculia bacterium]